MPNTTAYVVLFSWPVVAFVLFRLFPRAQALCITIIGGYLLLPHGLGVNLPMVPTFDKTLIPALSAAVFSVLLGDKTTANTRRTSVSKGNGAETVAPDSREFPRKRGREVERRNRKDGHSLDAASRLGDRIEKTMLLLLIITPFLTVLQNAAPYSAGPRTLPGLRLYDAFSIVLSSFVFILPYLLGRRYLARPREHLILLVVISAAGLLYSVPTLFEIRMSPQLSRWLYGYLAQDWRQTMRGDGFRPVVFLQHGLWLAIFMAMAVISSFTLWRQERNGRGKWLLAGLWLFGTLALSRSLGGLAVALLLTPMALFMRTRTQMVFAALIALSFVTYPLLRGADLVPVYRVTELIRTMSPARAQSLEFRLGNEDRLLAHAKEKALVGWGAWGRDRVFDPVTGRDLSVTDGEWIIVVSQTGWLGYIARFGLLTAPIILLFWYRRMFDVGMATSGLSLALSANLIDMVPNATLTPVTWLIAGALAGRLRYHEGSRLGSGRQDQQSRLNLRHPTSVVRVRNMEC